MYNFESAIVECGQRPPVSIDTSRPAEDSRQIRARLEQVKMGNTIIYETQTTNALNMPTSYKLNNGKLTGTSGYNAWGTLCCRKFVA